MKLREIRNCDLYNEIVIGSHIKCMNAAIYYEDDKPHLKYMGQFEDAKTSKKYVIEFLKISLEMIAIESCVETECKYNRVNDFYKNLEESILRGRWQNVFFENKINDHGVFFKIYAIEKDMTKEEIEKELGYPINIVER